MIAEGIVTVPDFPPEYLNWVPPPGYKTQSADTEPYVEKFVFDQLRALPMWERAKRLTALNQGLQLLAIAGIKQRNTGITEDEVRVRLLVQRFGAETVRQLRAAGKI